ncbi:uncharacterized protein A4U43_C05F17940 [Asparagus officinalis]|uniref:Uncharacterized protein n=1 Tax=Asparagus officinalis TaxID=4686 RepID=A0A5P1EWU2_ASPOF|nr:uncharacterized protein A4U43_C05F17940 [Asparagus officinalis]
MWPSFGSFFHLYLQCCSLIGFEKEKKEQGEVLEEDFVCGSRLFGKGKLRRRRGGLLVSVFNSLMRSISNEVEIRMPGRSQGDSSPGSCRRAKKRLALYTPAPYSPSGWPRLYPSVLVPPSVFGLLHGRCPLRRCSGHGGDLDHRPHVARLLVETKEDAGDGGSLAVA